jgi:hypothetical protein
MAPRIKRGSRCSGFISEPAARFFAMTSELALVAKSPRRKPTPSPRYARPEAPALNWYWSRNAKINVREGRDSRKQ